MAAQNKKSILSGVFGDGRNVAKAIAADTSLPATGYQDPPPGIRKGIAQLEEVKFDVYKSGTNEGKPYFSATANILEPYEHTFTPTSQGEADGEETTVKVAGMMTRIQIPCFDQKPNSGPNMGKVTATADDQLKKAAQQMRALGADTSKVRVASDLIDVAELLTNVSRNPETPIYINFSTSVRKAMKKGEADGVWQNWNGTQGLEDYTPPQEGAAESATDDQTGSSYVDDADPQKALAEVQSVDDEPDLDALAEAAAADDADAQNRLIELATKATGMTEAQINDIEGIDYAGVVLLIKGEHPSQLDDSGVGAAKEAPAPAEWKKGDHCGYKPMVKKMGKMVPSPKPVECSIESVNKTKKVATLKNTVDGATVYKDVSWDDLIELT